MIDYLAESMASRRSRVEVVSFSPPPPALLPRRRFVGVGGRLRLAAVVALRAPPFPLILLVFFVSEKKLQQTEFVE